MAEEQKGKAGRLMENSKGTTVLELNSEGELRPGIMKASEHMQNPCASLRNVSRDAQASQSFVSIIPQALCPLSVGFIRGSKPVPPVYEARGCDFQLSHWCHMRTL